MPSKFNNKQTEVAGYVFDSKREAARYGELALLEKAGEITELELQPKFTLIEGFRDSKGTWRRPITYTADFRYQEDGIDVVEDVKGHKTKVFLIKQKLFLNKYPDIDFRLT